MKQQQISIRDAQIADAAVIADLNMRLARETEALMLDAEVIGRGVARVLADPAKGRYWVAEVAQSVGDGSARAVLTGGVAATVIVGCTMVTYEFSDWRDADLWWIQSVYIRADWRRRGVFRALYSHVREAARAAGAGGLRLYVEKENVAAQQTYASLGMRLSPYFMMSELFWATGTEARE